MDISARDWSQQYDSLKKRIQHQRIKGIQFTNDDLRGIEKQLNLLESQLKIMSNNTIQYELTSSELARRELIVENLKKTTSSIGINRNTPTSSTPYSSGANNSVTNNPLRTQPSNDRNIMQEKIKNQDDMVLEIGLGVDRLRNKALVIGEESKSHVRLLDDLDSNVEIATAALQEEAKHAAEIKEKGKVCYMYICIAVEVFIIVLLLIIAFST